MSREDRPGIEPSASPGPPSLFDHLALVWRRRWLLVCCVLFAGLMAVVLAVCLPDEFEATAHLLPQRGDGSSLDLLLGESATAAGMARAAFGLESKDKVYVGFLKTRRILESVARKFDLQSIYEAEDMDQTLAALTEAARFEITKEDLLAITVTDRDPERAAKMANFFVDQLQQLAEGLDDGKAGKERRFLEAQLDACRQRLSRAEDLFRRFKEEHRTIELESQAKASIEALADLYGRLQAERVRYEQLTLSRKDQDPLVLQSLAAQGELREQIRGLEAGPGPVSLPARAPGGEREQSAMISVSAMPGLALQFGRLYRAVKVEEAVFELLSQQLVLARIREQREPTALQVVERAVAPVRKTRPRRSMMVLAGSFMGGLFGLFGVFFLEGLSRYRRRAGGRSPADSAGAPRSTEQRTERLTGSPPVIRRDAASEAGEPQACGGEEPRGGAGA